MSLGRVGRNKNLKGLKESESESEEGRKRKREEKRDRASETATEEMQSNRGHLVASRSMVSLQGLLEMKDTHRPRTLR